MVNQTRTLKEIAFFKNNLRFLNFFLITEKNLNKVFRTIKGTT